MMDAVIEAGTRLAEALRAENEALAALDLGRAATMATAKMQASEALAAATAAATRSGMRAVGEERGTTAALAERLQSLGSENRRLLEHAIALQSRVIETIASAALPRAAAPGYGAMGRARMLRQPPPLAISARA
ncbi:hypothetical protein [Rhodovarius sp.]|jgi:hypothetical protein|uniref:hypothetical protein n=1 Tax=Rhodovarius sp. TaxID=2972673 RepID=UPI0033412BE1